MKAVVLAAGEGVRLRPLTATRPKHLLPLGGKPILEHVLTTIKRVGVREALLVVGYLGHMLQEAFGDGSKLGLKIEYATQKGILGTGRAVSLAEGYVGDKEFLVVYGDIYLKPTALNQVLQAHRKGRGKNLLAVVEAENPENYGVVKLDRNNRLLEILEKPGKPPSKLINAGVYVFTPHIFGEIRKVGKSPRGEVEITEAIQRLSEHEGVHAVRIGKEDWLDIGRPWDLLEANERVLKEVRTRIMGKVESGAYLKGPVRVEQGSHIKSGAYIEGPVFVGEGSTVGPNCCIRPYTSLGRNVKIGSACEVKNSIIMDNTRIPHLSYVGDSIVGENCNFGAGTITGNIRFDNKPVKMLIKAKLTDSGRRKLGVIVGDNVQTGINVNFMPGVKVGSNSQIGPNVVVKRDVPGNTRLTVIQQLKFEEINL